VLIALAGSVVALRWTSLTYTEEWELLPFESSHKELNDFLIQAHAGHLVLAQQKAEVCFCGDGLPRHVKHRNSPLK